MLVFKPVLNVVYCYCCSTVVTVQRLQIDKKGESWGKIRLGLARKSTAAGGGARNFEFWWAFTSILEGRCLLIWGLKGPGPYCSNHHPSVHYCYCCYCWNSNNKGGPLTFYSSTSGLR